MIAIVGASGSGKSTLLNILGGLDVPSAGRAVVAGHDLTRMDGASGPRYRRQVVGFVWQQTARNLLALPDGARERRAADDPRRRGRPGAPAAGDASCWTSSACRTRRRHRPDRAVRRRAAARGDRRRARQRAPRPARRRADRRARQRDSAEQLFGAAAPGQRASSGRPSSSSPTTRSCQRPCPADRRHPRRPDEHRDASRRTELTDDGDHRVDRRGVRGPRPGRPPAAAAPPTSRRSGCGGG